VNQTRYGKVVLALALLSPLALSASTGAAQVGNTTPSDARELPVHRVPNIGMAAEFYFSPTARALSAMPSARATMPFTSTL
jgi:hypothetical protein